MAAESRDIIEQRAEITNGGQSQPVQSDDNIRNKVAMGMGTGNKSGDWRKTLSGALDEERLIFAMVVLLIFYIGYTAGNAFHDNNAKDEDVITRNCTCKPPHRTFYISWLTICFILWTSIHLYVQMLGTRCFKGFCCLLSCSNHDQETICGQNKCKNAYDGKEISSINDKSFYEQCHIALKQLYSKIKSCIFDDDDIHRYENYLWTQYYELYAIGITKDTKMFNNRSVAQIFANYLNRDETDSSRKSENKTSAHDDMIACPINYNFSSCGDQCISFVTHYGIHIILYAIRFLAQLVVVPLLMMQMFDTYAFLCLAADNYCTTGAEYDLHLDQTAITFGFYCSLMLSYVTSIMLCWIPRPKRKN